MKFKNILVTGGCGFIGSNFLHFIFEQDDFGGRVTNADKLTYAGNPDNLKDIQMKYGESRYFFEKIDIVNYSDLESLFNKYDVDCVIHFAAETHVDRSITGPAEFIHANIVGTFNLLELARRKWDGRKDVLFHHISTDEVYGSLGNTGYFYEDTPYNPRSPYSASKAASDHIVMAYFYTYALPVTISNCSNNYGPYQFPEKLIPLMINNMIEEKPLPVYGNGQNVRDWLYVIDHCSGIWEIIKNGKRGETYNIGGENEWANIDLLQVLCEKVASEKGKDKDYYKRFIKYVKDRAGHDRRYAINCDKIKTELGWKQSVNSEQGLDQTVKWYIANSEWMENIKSGEYRNWIQKNYRNR
jgi:dTDP-glucose 4,6-dehydratase